MNFPNGALSGFGFVLGNYIKDLTICKLVLILITKLSRPVLKSVMPNSKESL